ncbi:MAG: lectin-like protein, partial [Phycisphaerales bacterium]
MLDERSARRLLTALEAPVEVRHQGRGVLRAQVAALCGFMFSRPASIAAFSLSVGFLLPIASSTRFMVASQSEPSVVAPPPDTRSREMQQIRTMAAVSALALVATHSALGQAVQWRVEDGGNGHWYAESSERLSWVSAKNACTAISAQLACTETAAECQFLRGLHPAGEDFVFVGLYQDTESGTYSEPDGGWRWISGAELDPSLWQPGEPNNALGGERYGELEGPGRPPFLNDVIPDAILLYFVEWSADCNNDGIVDYGQCRD